MFWKFFKDITTTNTFKIQSSHQKRLYEIEMATYEELYIFLNFSKKEVLREEEGEKHIFF